MSKKVLAIAIFRAVESKEKECVEMSQAFYQLLRSKGYANDSLYRSGKDGDIYIDIREWASAEAAIKAHQDPDVHQFWEKLGKVSKIVRIYESLEEIP